MSFRQRYLNFIFEESKSLFSDIEKACIKASEQEKSIYDRSKTRSIYSNLAVHLIKSLRKQNQLNSVANSSSNNKTKLTGDSASTSSIASSSKYSLKMASTVKTTKASASTTNKIEMNKNSLKLVNNTKKSATNTTTTVKRVSYSHEAMLAGPKAAKMSYSINNKKRLTIKDLNCRFFK